MVNEENCGRGTTYVGHEEGDEAFGCGWLALGCALDWCGDVVESVAVYLVL
jgi:hypothetical protein